MAVLQNMDAGQHIREFFDCIKTGYYVLEPKVKAFGMVWLVPDKEYPQDKIFKLVANHFHVLGSARKYEKGSLINPFNLLGLKLNAQESIVEDRLELLYNAISEVKDHLQKMSGKEITASFGGGSQERQHRLIQLGIFETEVRGDVDLIMRDDTFRKQLADQWRAKPAKSLGFIENIGLNIRSLVTGGGATAKQELVEKLYLEQDKFSTYCKELKADNPDTKLPDENSSEVSNTRSKPAPLEEVTADNVYENQKIGQDR